MSRPVHGRRGEYEQPAHAERNARRAAEAKGLVAEGDSEPVEPDRHEPLGEDAGDPRGDVLLPPEDEAERDANGDGPDGEGAEEVAARDRERPAAHAVVGEHEAAGGEEPRPGEPERRRVPDADLDREPRRAPRQAERDEDQLEAHLDRLSAISVVNRRRADELEERR